MLPDYHSWPEEPPARRSHPCGEPAEWTQQDAHQAQRRNLRQRNAIRAARWSAAAVSVLALAALILIARVLMTIWQVWGTR